MVDSCDADTHFMGIYECSVNKFENISFWTKVQIARPVIHYYMFN